MNESIKYRISSRQRKELYVRGRQLQIALPLDGREAEDADPLGARAADAPGDSDSE